MCFRFYKHYIDSKIKRLYYLDKMKGKSDSKCKIESKDKKKIKRYWAIFKRLVKRMKKILRYVLAKELGRTMEIMKLRNKALNLPILLDEMVHKERKKTDCIDKLLLRNKILSRDIVMIFRQHKGLQDDTIKILKLDKKMLMSLKKDLSFKNLPLPENQKDGFKSASTDMTFENYISNSEQFKLILDYNLQLRGLKNIVRDKRLNFDKLF